MEHWMPYQIWGWPVPLLTRGPAQELRWGRRHWSLKQRPPTQRSKDCLKPRDHQRRQTETHSHSHLLILQTEGRKPSLHVRTVLKPLNHFVMWSQKGLFFHSKFETERSAMPFLQLDFMKAGRSFLDSQIAESPLIVSTAELWKERLLSSLWCFCTAAHS